MQTEVRSWSESLAFTPEQRVLAASEQEVVAAVTAARGRGRSIRPVGSLHSSTPIIATDDTMLDMRGMHGVTWHDADHRLAHVLPGTGLAEAGVQLHAAGLSMPNLGDVDYQSISGAIGTGTHGTGLTLPNLSAMLVGGVLITADGGRLPFGVDAGDSEESDLLRAARVGLGTLGVLTSLTLRLVPAFDLRVQKHMTRIDWVLENFEELAAGSRHVDFYWYPRSAAGVRTQRVSGHGDNDQWISSGFHRTFRVSGQSMVMNPHQHGSHPNPLATGPAVSGAQYGAGTGAYAYAPGAASTPTVPTAPESTRRSTRAWLLAGLLGILGGYLVVLSLPSLALEVGISSGYSGRMPQLVMQMLLGLTAVIIAYLNAPGRVVGRILGIAVLLAAVVIAFLLQGGMIGAGVTGISPWIRASTMSADVWLVTGGAAGWLLAASARPLAWLSLLLTLAVGPLRMMLLLQDFEQGFASTAMSVLMLVIALIVLLASKPRRTAAPREESFAPHPTHQQHPQHPSAPHLT